MHVVRDPDAEATLAFLRTELAAVRNRRNHVVEIVASCTVDYQGRAASQLDTGERLILVKPDGTLLVHSSTKSKPVNWMPPGENGFTVAKEDDGVLLTALRKRPHEEAVRIRLRDVRLLVAVPLRDAEELVLRRTEGDLHRLFFEHPGLLEEGLVFQRGEKRTRRGPVDLWGTDARGHRVLAEVKRSKAGIAEATQLWRYVEMERTGRYADGDATKEAGAEGARPTVRGLLIAPGFSAEAERMLADHGLEAVSIDWDRLLAHIEAPRAAGQATLGRFGDEAEPQKAVEPTLRTGRKRSR